MITADAARKIDRFNEVGLHYNLVAIQIYAKRFTQGTDTFSVEYLRYIIAGLISFDMERMMGSGFEKHDFNGTGFAFRLNTKVQQIRPELEPLMNANLTELNLQQHSPSILKAYNVLSPKGTNGLNEKKEFHVGATKILHFLNPWFFIIVDSNAASAFRMSHGIPFRNTTQPGYSAELYLQCMECAKKEIIGYGVERFQALEPDTPITRIYDKLTFATGARL
jgi:hypothetical protein